MKKTSKFVTAFIAFFALLALTLQMNGCKPQETPSLYDPNWKSLPQPVVDSVSPSGSALAGIDTVTIYGKNFSASKDSDGVYFNATLINGSAILSASTTRLIVKAPTVSGDTIQVRVFVIGAVNFSSTYIYKLIPAVSPFSKLASGEGGYGITIGPDDSVYVSLSNINYPGTKDEGIFEIGPISGIRAAAPTVQSTNLNISWSAIKFGPDGNVYAVKGNRAVYQLKPGQSNPGGSPWMATFTPSATSFNDMDFDQNDNLWVAGNNKAIYSINVAAQTSKSFPFTGNVRAVRYFNGNLYFAANVGTAPAKVYEAPIISDSLGTPQVYFDLSSDPTGVTNIYAITFSADGDMYAGTDSSDYLLVVHPGGTFETPFALYSTGSGRVLDSPIKSLVWIGQNLYATTGSGELLKFIVRKQGAPYYGIH